MDKNCSVKPWSLTAELSVREFMRHSPPKKKKKRVNKPSLCPWLPQRTLGWGLKADDTTHGTVLEASFLGLSYHSIGRP